MTLFIHRSRAIVMTLALAIGLLAFQTPVSAQGQGGTDAPGTWQSSINLQNTSAAPATVTIDFYNSAGTLITSYAAAAPIPANGALSIFVPNQVTNLTNGQFSAVVNSTETVKATVNTSSTNSTSAPWSAFGYEGFDATTTGTTLFFPGMYKNYYGFLSELVIQNAGTGAATLSAQFFNKQGVQIATAALGTLAPNTSKTFPISKLTTTPALQDGPLGLFGVKVTSTEGVPLAGLVNIWKTGSPAGTASYGGFKAEGSTTVYAPALYKNYYGFNSALTVQNVSSGAANGTITYSNGTSVPFALPANASLEFYQPNDPTLPSGNQAGVFSAKVTATSGAIVGLVSLSATGRGEFASYNAPGQATNAVNISNVMADYYGYFTAVTVQNTCASSTNVTITYANGQTRNAGTVAANGTVNIIHLNNAGDVLPNTTSTSAVVSSSNPACNLVAVIQHNTANGVQGYNPAKANSDFLLALSGTAK